MTNPVSRILRKAAPGIGMLALCLAACAPPLKDPWGLAVSRGQTPAPPQVPETFQADLGVLSRAPGAFPFSARLYAEPLGRYRLDVFGFPSLIAASWLWEDGGWILVRHDTREIRSGTGTALEQEGLPLRLPDVHAVLGFLWGAPLPGFPGADSAGPADADGVVRWMHHGELWEARFEPATGLCREVRSPSLTLRYKSHRRHGNLVIAEEAEIFSGGGSLAVLQVRGWIASPPWKKDPFPLTVPEGYRRSR